MRHRTPSTSIIEPQENTSSGVHSIVLEELSSPSVMVSLTIALSHLTAHIVEISDATIDFFGRESESSRRVIR